MGSPAAVLLAVHPTRFGRYVLAVHRADGRGWALPGGYVERGETPAAAAVRETAEETGLVARGVSHVLSVGAVDVYAASAVEGKLRRSPEGEPAWVPVSWVLAGPFGDVAAAALERVTWPTVVVDR